MSSVPVGIRIIHNDTFDDLAINIFVPDDTYHILQEKSKI